MRKNREQRTHGENTARAHGKHCKILEHIRSRSHHARARVSDLRVPRIVPSPGVRGETRRADDH